MHACCVSKARSGALLAECAPVAPVRVWMARDHGTPHDLHHSDDTHGDGSTCPGQAPELVDDQGSLEGSPQPGSAQVQPDGPRERGAPPTRAPPPLPPSTQPAGQLQPGAGPWQAPASRHLLLPAARARWAAETWPRCRRRRACRRSWPGGEVGPDEEAGYGRGGGGRGRGGLLELLPLVPDSQLPLRQRWRWALRAPLFRSPPPPRSTC